MRLTVRHVKRTKAGTWGYRRKVPKHLVAKIGKREFKQVLGKSEAEALKKYQTFHAAIEASIMNSDVERVVEPNAGWTFERTALEDFRTALANLRVLGIDPMAAVYSDPEGDDATNVRDALIDNIASKYPLDDDGHPEVSSRVDTMMIHAQQVDENFFKLVDGWAADALTLLEGGSRNLRWSNHNRSAWARFLISLMLRCPEDIEHLRAIWYEDFKAADDESEARYANSREHDDPPTFAEFLASQPVVTFEKSLFEVYFSLVDNKSVGGVINHMRWRVINTSDTGLELPTSDRPVIRSPNLKAPDGHIALPIGPTLYSLQQLNLRQLKASSKRPVVRL